MKNWKSLLGSTAMILVLILGASQISAQHHEWIDRDFPGSFFRGVYEVDGDYFGSVTHAVANNDVLDSNSVLKLYRIHLNDTEGLALEENVFVSYPERYLTLAMEYVEITGVWIIVQSYIISPGLRHYRVLLCDREFNIINQESIEAAGFPVIFGVDSDDNHTYVLGSIINPLRNELFYVKYLHSTPHELSPIVIRESEPVPKTWVTSMDIDDRTGHLLLFSASGITVMDTNLHIVVDYTANQVLTSDHGHVLDADSYYYSHGARDSAWNIPLRRLVVHKYNDSFEIMRADTLGWSGQDNYPFINKSIDARDSEVLVGGHLDGPFNSPNIFTNQKKFYIAKYDLDLNQLWYKEYGGDKAYWLSGLKLIKNGEALVYGYITDTLDGFRYGYLMYVDANGDIISSNTIPTQPEYAIRVVNDGQETFRLYNPEGLTARVILHDLQGRRIMDLPVHSGLNEIPIQNLPAGLYPYSILHQGNIISGGKWVKAK